MMKAFLTKFWNNTGSKGLVFGSIGFMIIWSITWSLRDGKLNLEPVLIGLGLVAFALLMTWIFRNRA